MDATACVHGYQRDNPSYIIGIGQAPNVWAHGSRHNTLRGQNDANVAISNQRHGAWKLELLSGWTPVYTDREQADIDMHTTHHADTNSLYSVNLYQKTGNSQLLSGFRQGK